VYARYLTVVQNSGPAVTYTLTERILLMQFLNTYWFDLRLFGMPVTMTGAIGTVVAAAIPGVYTFMTELYGFVKCFYAWDVVQYITEPSGLSLRVVGNKTCSFILGSVSVYVNQTVIGIPAPGTWT
jgi:hypothetical protein